MEKPHKRPPSPSLAKLLLRKAKTPNSASPISKPAQRHAASTSKKTKPALRSPHTVSKPVLSRGNSSEFIEEALRKSIELLEAVQAMSAGKGKSDGKGGTAAGSQRAVSPITDRQMCNSSTQTTEDKSTQVSLTSPTFRNTSKPSSEIKSLKESLRTISDRLRDLSSPYLQQSSGTAGILTFRSPEEGERGNFSGKKSYFVSSVNGPLLSDKKHLTTSPSETPQGLHLSSLEIHTHSSPSDPHSDDRHLLDIMNELELS